LTPGCHTVSLFHVYLSAFLFFCGCFLAPLFWSSLLGSRCDPGTILSAIVPFCPAAPPVSRLFPGKQDQTLQRPIFWFLFEVLSPAHPFFYVFPLTSLELLPIFLSRVRLPVWFWVLRGSLFRFWVEHSSVFSPFEGFCAPCAMEARDPWVIPFSLI